MLMNDIEKEQHIKAVEKKYKGRRGFRALFGKAQRETYRDDILQPFEPRFKQKWYTAWKNRNLINDAVDKEVIKKEKELNEIYRNKPSKNVVTREQKILKYISLEHPSMMNEEDIILGGYN